MQSLRNRQRVLLDSNGASKATLQPAMSVQLRHRLSRRPDPSGMGTPSSFLVTRGGRPCCQDPLDEPIWPDPAIRYAASRESEGANLPFGAGTSRPSARTEPQKAPAILPQRRNQRLRKLSDHTVTLDLLEHPVQTRFSDVSPCRTAIRGDEAKDLIM